MQGELLVAGVSVEIDGVLKRCQNITVVDGGVIRMKEMYDTEGKPMKVFERTVKTAKKIEMTILDVQLFLCCVEISHPILYFNTVKVHLAGTIIYKREPLHHFHKCVSKKPLKITNTTPNYYTTLDLLSINGGLVYKLNKMIRFINYLKQLSHPT